MDGRYIDTCVRFLFIRGRTANASSGRRCGGARIRIDIHHAGEHKAHASIGRIGSASPAGESIFGYFDACDVIGRSDDRCQKKTAKEPASAPTIDWYDAKDNAVSRAIERELETVRQKTFSSGDRNASIPQPVMTESSDFPWDPLHGKRAGLTDQGLFFVKVSEKCLIVTVFLVCGFGGKLEPNGGLFDGLPAKLDEARERELP